MTVDETDSRTGGQPEIEVEKDHVLWVSSDGKISGDYDAKNEPSAQSAINEETGEINWDCPCLQPALAPPCGEFFREAFSCFVASQTEPKGRDCLEQITAMQECFRQHPEIYMPKDEDEAEAGPVPSQHQEQEEVPPHSL